MTLGVDMCDAGVQIMLNDDEGNFIVNKRTGAAIRLHKEGNIYVFYVEVNDHEPSTVLVAEASASASSAGRSEAEARDAETRTAEAGEVRPFHATRTPDAETVREHNLTHWPHRERCRVCTRARGRTHRHGESDVEWVKARVHVDIPVGSQTAGKRPFPALNFCDERSKKTAVTMIQLKGLEHSYAAKWLAAQLEICRLASTLRTAEVRQRCDLCGMWANVPYRRCWYCRQSPCYHHGRCCWANPGRRGRVKENPVGDKNANGAMESIGDIIEDLIREFKGKSEILLGITIETDAPSMTWIVIHAGAVYTCYAVDSYGRTPYETIHGRPFRLTIVTIDECVPYKVRFTDGKLVKCELWRKRDLFLDVVERTNEYAIGQDDGSAVRVKDIETMNESERKDLELVAKPKATPWQTGPKGDELEAPVRGQLLPPLRPEPLKEHAEKNEPAGRNVYITWHLIDKFGATQDCPACVGGARTHSDDCGKRISTEIANDPHEASEGQADEADEVAQRQRLRF